MPLILSSITWVKRVRPRWSPRADHALLAHSRPGIPSQGSSSQEQDCFSEGLLTAGMAPSNPGSSSRTLQPSRCTLRGSHLFITAHCCPDSLRHAQITPVLRRLSISPVFHLKTLHRKLQISLHSLHHQVIPICKVFHHFLSGPWLRYQTALARKSAVLSFTKGAFFRSGFPLVLTAQLTPLCILTAHSLNRKAFSL